MARGKHGKKKLGNYEFNTGKNVVSGYEELGESLFQDLKEKHRKEDLRARASAKLNDDVFDHSITKEEQEKATQKSISRHYDGGGGLGSKYTEEMRIDSENKRAFQAIEQKANALQNKRDAKAWEDQHKEVAEVEQELGIKQLQESPSTIANNFGIDNEDAERRNNLLKKTREKKPVPTWNEENDWADRAAKVISDPPKPVKEPPPHTIQNIFQDARDKRKALEKFANETSNLSEEQKGKIFSKRFLKATKDMDGKQTSREALQRFSDRYGLDVDLSGYKTSMRGRIWNRLNGRENLTEQEAIDKLYNAYFNKTNEYIGEQKKRLLNGEISKEQFTRRVNAGYSDYAARKAGGITHIAKNGNHFKFGGKIGAVAGLVGLGAVIGSMFSGGHKSNAELYNPNPQPQYYS